MCRGGPFPPRASLKAAMRPPLDLPAEVVEQDPVTARRGVSARSFQSWLTLAYSRLYGTFRLP